MADRIVTNDDSGATGAAIATSSLIQTIVWSVVVLVILVVGIMVLINYNIL